MVFDESDRFQILEKFGNYPEVTKDFQNACSVDPQTFQADWIFLKRFSQPILSYFSWFHGFLEVRPIINAPDRKKSNLVQVCL